MNHRHRQHERNTLSPWSFFIVFSVGHRVKDRVHSVATMKTIYSELKRDVELHMEPLTVLLIGLSFVRKRRIRLEDRRTSISALENSFHKHFGSSPKTIADIWNFMNIALSNEDEIEECEVSLKGFQSFLSAHHFLWAYPKNAEIQKDNMGFNDVKDACGYNLWKWVKR